MRITLAMLAVVLLLGVGCGERAAQPAVDDKALAALAGVARKPATEMKPLNCTIRGQATCELGSAPKVTVAITNQSDTDVFLVRSLDGSQDRARYPYSYFEVIGPDGKSTVHEFIREDPFANGLRENDFVKVPPGGTFDPHDHGHGVVPAIQLHPSTFGKAQEYRIRFVYSTKSDNIVEWRGDDWNRLAADEKLKVVDMLRRVPKVEVTSNVIKLTVVEASE